MAMSKQNFIALADTLKAFLETNAGCEMGEISRGILMQHLAAFCEDQNPRFKRQLWLDYVTGTGGPHGGKPKTPKTKAEYQPKTGQKCSCRPGIPE